MPDAPTSEIHRLAPTENGTYMAPLDVGPGDRKRRLQVDGTDAGTAIGMLGWWLWARHLVEAVDGEVDDLVKGH